MDVPIGYSVSESGQVFDPSGVPVNLATINAGTAGQPAQQSTNPLYNYLNSFNNGTADINSMVQMATQQGAQFGLTPQDLADASKGYQWQGGLTNGSDVGSVVRDTIVRALNAKGQPQLAQQYASSPGVQNMLQQTQATMWNNINNVQHASNGGLFGSLSDLLGPALAIGGLAMGLPTALDALGIGGAAAGGAAALDGAAGAMGLLPASTIAADTAAGLVSSGAGLGSLGLGSAASAAGSGAMDFNLFDPSTWSNPFSGFFSSSGPTTAPAQDFSSLLNADGSLNYNALAAQDAANFGTTGVDALGNSLGYSTGADYWTPGTTSSGGLASQVAQYVANNPGSTVQTALKALGGSSGMLPLSQLASGLMGYQAANSAATTQATAAQNAVNAQLGMFNTLNGQQAPYRNAGYSALSSLLGGEGLGPASGGVSSGQFTHTFDANDLATNLSPSYNFMLSQGLGALGNENSMTGGRISGNSLKALMDYGTNYASTGYQQAFDNYNTGQNNVFNRLSSLAGLGQVANNQSTTAGTNIAGGVGQSTQNIGTAQAGGIVGANNALTGGLTSAAALYSGLPASYY